MVNFTTTPNPEEDIIRNESMTTRIAGLIHTLNLPARLVQVNHFLKDLHIVHFKMRRINSIYQDQLLLQVMSYVIVIFGQLAINNLYLN